jgi:hypothetical protein
MTRGQRLTVVLLVLGVIGAPITAALLVSRNVHAAEAAQTPYEQLAADSAHADSAAFASLPDGLEALLDLRAAIGPPAPKTLALYECTQIAGTREKETRRRLQVRLPDSSAVVLFAVADRTSGALERVELLRRIPHVGQRGLIWDGLHDRITSVWWFENLRGQIRQEERAALPRGGPVPRAVRALGRQLLVAPCADSVVNSPTKPISGSRN